MSVCGCSSRFSNGHSMENNTDDDAAAAAAGADNDDTKGIGKEQNSKTIKRQI